MAVALLTVPLALNYLGLERFGMWLTISSMVALLSFSDLGVGYGLLNSLTRSIALGDSVAARRQVSSAVLVLAIVAVTLGIVAIAAVAYLPWPNILAVHSPEAVEEARPAVAAFLALFLVGLPLSVANQVRFARQEGYLVHLTAGIGNVAAVGALIAVINSRGGVPALVIALAGPPLAAVAANAFILFTRQAPSLAPSFRAFELATGVRLMRVGFLFLVLQLSVTVAFATDTIVLARMIGPEAVASYGVAHQLFQIPIGIVATATSPLWPAYGEAIARGDTSWVAVTFRRSMIAALAISLPAALVLVLFGSQIISAWVGSSVGVSFILLLAFGIWTVQSSIGRAIAMLLNGANEIRLQAIAAAVMAVANIGLSVYLTSRIGVPGVVCGTVVTYALFVLLPMSAYVPGVLRRIGVTRSSFHGGDSGASERG